MNREYGFEEYKSRIIDAIQSDPVLKKFEVTVSDKIRVWTGDEEGDKDSFNIDVNALYSDFIPENAVISALKNLLIMYGVVDSTQDFRPYFLTELTNVKYIQPNEVYKIVVESSDIALLLKYVLDETDGHTYTSNVDEKLLDRFGISSDEAFDLALKNMQIRNPATIFSFRESVDHFSSGTFTGGTPLFEVAKDGVDPSDMFISVKGLAKGGVAIFYPETLPKLYELIGEDFYVVFTSKHEAAVHPKSFIKDEQDLAHVLFETIEDAVTDEDFLTYDIFMYQKADDGTFKLVKV